MSRIDPRGGEAAFSNKSEIQKSLKYPIGGGGASLLWKKTKIFPFFDYETSPYEIRECPMRHPKVCRFFRD